jgi:hypothetical protein
VQPPRLIFAGMNSTLIKQATELACRLYVFFFINVYGIGKILGGQFYTPDRIPPDVAAVPLGKAESFDLAWTFMGHSYAYILFVGILQIVGAWMLLFRRTKLIGACILLPVLANIIVFDINFLDMYGALLSACIYFTMLLIILWLNKEQMVAAIRSLLHPSPPVSVSFKQKLGIFLAACGIMALVFLCDQLLVNFIGHGKG